MTSSSLSNYSDKIFGFFNYLTENIENVVSAGTDQLAEPGHDWLGEPPAFTAVTAGWWHNAAAPAAVATALPKTTPIVEPRPTASTVMHVST